MALTPLTLDFLTEQFSPATGNRLEGRFSNSSASYVNVDVPALAIEEFFVRGNLSQAEKEMLNGLAEERVVALAEAAEAELKKKRKTAITDGPNPPIRLLGVELELGRVEARLEKTPTASLRRVAAGYSLIYIREVERWLGKKDPTFPRNAEDRRSYSIQLLLAKERLEWIFLLSASALANQESDKLFSATNKRAQAALGEVVGQLVELQGVGLR
jgi:hypothetical protein